MMVSGGFMVISWRLFMIISALFWLLLMIYDLSLMISGVLQDCMMCFMMISAFLSG